MGPHIATKRLIAYRQGTLPEEERDAVQEHLSLCGRCTGLLRELRDFETGAAEAGPESQKQEAWEALVRRLPPKAPAVPSATKARRSYLVPAMAAALLLAVVGLSLWTMATVQEEKRRLAILEQQLEEREAALAAAQRSLAETERQLQEARRNSGRVEELEARIAELTASLEALRRETPDRIADSKVELSVAPRFVLRGQEAPEFLRGQGAVNPVRQADRVTLAFSLAEHPLFSEYRLELVNGNGKVLWTGRRPAGALLGDAGTSVSIQGLGPGRYRLRVEGMRPDRGERLAEYLLAVQ